jgi:hypothetical protein
MLSWHPARAHRLSDDRPSFAIGAQRSLNGELYHYGRNFLKPFGDLQKRNAEQEPVTDAQQKT